jgi:2-keto-4-pentenoate hydratase/2-oxohepta-3-ene-1,7-dioic acid hydratase in catechol pathway
MRLLRIGPKGAERPVLLTADGSWRDLRPVTAEIDGRFLAAGGLERARAADETDELPHLDATSERVGPPLTGIGKIIGIGLNYRDHAAETGAPIPAEPVVFMKAANSVVGPTDDVLIPPDSRKTDWEVELAVVIGRTARYLDSPEAAADVIAGYAISNDVSEREYQLERSSGQWDKGKSCETFNPFGPWLVTPDEIGDPQDLVLQLWVNGRLRQDSSTANMIFGVHHLVWYLSQFMVLDPGDVVNTGTPAGVAQGQPDQPYLRPGDVLEAAIDGLGQQNQTLRQADRSSPTAAATTPASSS